MTKRRFIEIATSVTVMAVLSIGCVVYASGEKEQNIPDSNVAEATEETETRYVYPVTPENEEWAELTHAEIVEACLVPEEVLETMSTRQLVTTFLDYPLLVIYSIGSMHDSGLLALYNCCNVLPVLMEREDCIEELLVAYENMNSEDGDNSIETDVLGRMLTHEDAVEKMNENQLERTEELREKYCYHLDSLDTIEELNQ